MKLAHPSFCLLPVVGGGRSIGLTPASTGGVRPEHLLTLFAQGGSQKIIFFSHPSWSSYWSWWGECIWGFCSLESSSELGGSIMSRPAPSADLFIPGWPIGGSPYWRWGSWNIDREFDTFYTVLEYRDDGSVSKLLLYWRLFSVCGTPERLSSVIFWTSDSPLDIGALWVEPDTKCGAPCSCWCFASRQSRHRTPKN